MIDDKKISKRDLNRLGKATEFVEGFREAAPRMELQSALAFLTIARLLGERGREPLYVGELAEYLGVTKTSASRNVRYFTALGSKRSKTHQEEGGLGWIELKQDPDHLSRKIVHLTDKGRQALDDLLALF